MVFPGSRPAVWTMALALTVCLCGAVVRGTQDKPAPASAKDSSAARADKRRGSRRSQQQKRPDRPARATRPWKEPRPRDDRVILCLLPR